MFLGVSLGATAMWLGWSRNAAAQDTGGCVGRPYGMAAYGAGTYGGQCEPPGASSIALSATPHASEKLREFGFTLTVKGRSGPLSVESSEDLRVWTEVVTLPSLEGAVVIQDSSARSLGRRYYRARTP